MELLTLVVLASLALTDYERLLTTNKRHLVSHPQDTAEFWNWI